MDILYVCECANVDCFSLEIFCMSRIKIKKNTRLSHSNNDFGLITTIYNNLQESNCSFHKYGCFVFCFLFYFLFSTIKLQIYTDKPRLFFFAIIKYGSEFKIKIMHSSADNRWISSLFALDYIVFIG